jgi:hypothetical protein
MKTFMSERQVISLVIKVMSKYLAEDEAIVGLICKTASRKYSQKIGVINGDGILIEYANSDDEKIHISSIREAEADMSVLFDFGSRDVYDKQLIIMNHTLDEYSEILKNEFTDDDVVLIKNYVPSYKSEKTMFGPNELKSIFRKGIRIFALELDVRIQNSIFLGVMESFGCSGTLLDGRNGLKRQINALYKELTKED